MASTKHLIPDPCPWGCPLGPLGLPETLSGAHIVQDRVPDFVGSRRSCGEPTAPKPMPA